MTEYILHLLQMMGTTLRLPVSFVVIEFIGTMAFAISGIRLASAKQFDWFGAYIVGTATAVGGGTIRDIMLGIPPFWMTNPVYIICCGLSLLYVILFGKKSSGKRAPGSFSTPSAWLYSISRGWKRR